MLSSRHEYVGDKDINCSLVIMLLDLSSLKKYYYVSFSNFMRSDTEVFWTLNIWYKYQKWPQN